MSGTEFSDENRGARLYRFIQGIFVPEVMTVPVSNGLIWKIEQAVVEYSIVIIFKLTYGRAKCRNTSRAMIFIYFNGQVFLKITAATNLPALVL